MHLLTRNTSERHLGVSQPVGRSKDMAMNYEQRRHLLDTTRISVFVDSIPVLFNTGAAAAALADAGVGVAGTVASLAQVYAEAYSSLVRNLLPGHMGHDASRLPDAEAFGRMVDYYYEYALASSQAQDLLKAADTPLRRAIHDAYMNALTGSMRMHIDPMARTWMGSVMLAVCEIEGSISNPGIPSSRFDVRNVPMESSSIHPEDDVIMVSSQETDDTRRRMLAGLNVVGQKPYHELPLQEHAMRTWHENWMSGERNRIARIPFFGIGGLRHGPQQPPMPARRSQHSRRNGKLINAVDDLNISNSEGAAAGHYHRIPLEWNTRRSSSSRAEDDLDYDDDDDDGSSRSVLDTDSCMHGGRNGCCRCGLLMP